MSDAAELTALDIAEGFHLAQAAAALHATDVLARLRTASTAADLAARMGFDGEVLEGVLAFVAARTELVRAVGEKYVVGAGYDASARFVLDLHVRAFGPVSADLTRILRDPASAARRIDRRAQADAFADDEGDGALAGIVRQLGFGTVVEFGCAQGALLRRIAEADPQFRGFGVEANARACRAARERNRAVGVTRRVRIVQGDARHPERLQLPPAARAAEAVIARDFVNEMCRAGGAAAIGWMRELRRLFPGRILVVADYYGQLGRDPVAADRRVLLHDFVQLVSGQGVPPADPAGWTALYDAAGCRLAHAIEDPRALRFVHLVKL